jgi:hypothetical protein
MPDLRIKVNAPEKLCKFFFYMHDLFSSVGFFAHHML